MREAVFLFKDIKGVGHPLVAGALHIDIIIIIILAIIIIIIMIIIIIIIRR